MPQFNPSEEKVALATFPVAPAGLECAAELWLASNGAKVATSGEIPFISTGADQAISLPVTMPGAEGTYPVYLHVSSGGVLIQSFRAVEDVVIAPVALAGEISHIWMWHKALAAWGIVWTLPPAPPGLEKPEIPLNEDIHLVPYWTNRSEVSIVGHVDLEVTYPDGTKVSPSATGGQDTEELPGEGSGVEFSPAFTASQEGTYTITATLSSAGQVLDSVTFTLVVVPIPANLLANPGFEDAFEHWTAYTNYPGRAHWVPSDEQPYEGLKSAAFAASVGGRPVVCTLSQVVPWNDGYKGQTFQLSAMRGSYPAAGAHDIEGMLTFYIYDGVTYAQNAVYVSHGEAYREQSVVVTLSPNANKLEVIFQIVPPGDFHGSAIHLDKAILEKV